MIVIQIYILSILVKKEETKLAEDKKEESDEDSNSDDEDDGTELHPLLQAHRRPVKIESPKPEPKQDPVFMGYVPKTKHTGKVEDLRKVYLHMKYKKNLKAEKEKAKRKESIDKDELQDELEEFALQQLELEDNELNDSELTASTKDHFPSPPTPPGTRTPPRVETPPPGSRTPEVAMLDDASQSPIRGSKLSLPPVPGENEDIDLQEDSLQEAQEAARYQTKDEGLGTEQSENQDEQQISYTDPDQKPTVYKRKDGKTLILPPGVHPEDIERLDPVQRELLEKLPPPPLPPMPPSVPNLETEMQRDPSPVELAGSNETHPPVSHYDMHSQVPERFPSHPLDARHVHPITESGHPDFHPMHLIRNPLENHLRPNHDHMRPPPFQHAPDPRFIDHHLDPRFGGGHDMRGNFPAHPDMPPHLAPPGGLPPDHPALHGPPPHGTLPPTSMLPPPHLVRPRHEPPPHWEHPPPGHGVPPPGHIPPQGPPPPVGVNHQQFPPRFPERHFGPPGEMPPFGMPPGNTLLLLFKYLNLFIY